MFSSKSFSVQKSANFKPKLIYSINKSLDISFKELNFKIKSSHSQHKNTLTDICYHNNKIWTVGLDYKLNSWNPNNLSLDESRTAHNRGIVGVIKYKNLLITAAKSGKIKLWKEKFANQIQAHKNSLRCISENSDYFITANESIKLWTENTNFSEFFPNTCVLSLTGLCPDTFLTGCKDKIILWDKRLSRSVSEFIGNGPFLQGIKWDDFTFWSASDCCLNVIFT